MSLRHRSRSEREQLELFRALPGDLAPRDAQDLMASPFFSLAKTHRVTPINYRSGNIAIRVEAVPEHGMATIWDADILIWAASQIVQARDSGLRTSRLMAAPPYEILTSSAAATAHATITVSRRRSTGCNPPPSPQRCARPTNGAHIASPGSTNGPSAPTRTAAPTASISSFRTGSTKRCSTKRSC
jgi:hypothetical protein